MFLRPYTIRHGLSRRQSCLWYGSIHQASHTGWPSHCLRKNIRTSSLVGSRINLQASSIATDHESHPGLAGKPVPAGKTIPECASQMYRTDLHDYFETQTFDFGSRDHNSALKVLKRSMELIYPRERPLVCIDIEAYERQLSKVTEIGVAIYDPRVSLGRSIVPEIRTAHILVDTNLGLRNGRYVPDRKGFYMGGTSHIMSKKEIKRFFELTFQKYLGGGGCIVGHQVGGDLKWLDTIGVKIPRPLEIVDTLELHKLTRLKNGQLRALLRSLNVPHGYLHNAANDAYYTMLVALALCDPQVRKRYDLDTYKVLESGSKSAQAKRHEKFSDLAKLTTSDGETMFTSFETP